MFHPKKILVIKRDALGDVITVTPFLEVLRKNFPTAHIVYVIGNWSKAVLENNPNVDEIIVVNSEEWETKSFLKKIGARSRLIKQTKPKKFDTVFILQGPAPFNFWEKFAKKIGAKNRIGFKKYGKETSFTQSVELPKYKDHLFKILKKNRIEHYLDLLKASGIKDISNSGPKLFIKKEDKEKAEDFFEKNNLKNKKVAALAAGGAINPGMKQLSKRWPIERYVKLIDKLCNNFGFQTLLLMGGPSDKEVNTELQKRTKCNTTDSTGLFSIHGSQSLIERSSLFIGNDSGALHIASTTNTPIIALFGPTNPVVDGPAKLNGGKVLFHKTKFSPCYSEDCKGHVPCIEKITVEEVVEVVKEIAKLNS
ncbi:MAG: hypothetical protein ACD_63C00008G0003 [uncultured bacterium]|nr:MAG: hypothetical protein ACD_63C00008G0003 [uncultured bacterium]